MIDVKKLTDKIYKGYLWESFKDASLQVILMVLIAVGARAATGRGNITDFGDEDPTRSPLVDYTTVIAYNSIFFALIAGKIMEDTCDGSLMLRYTITIYTRLFLLRQWSVKTKFDNVVYTIELLQGKGLGEISEKIRNHHTPGNDSDTLAVTQAIEDIDVPVAELHTGMVNPRLRQLVFIIRAFLVMSLSILYASTQQVQFPTGTIILTVIMVGLPFHMFLSHQLVVDTRSRNVPDMVADELAVMRFEDEN